MRRSVLAGALVSLVSGCGPGLEGGWVGKIDCDAFSYNLRLDLERDSRLVYAGTGEQRRSFTNSQGFAATSIIDFEVTAELESLSGVQDAVTRFVCVSDVTEVDRPDGTTERSEGCVQERYEDYALLWDGEDRLRLTSGRQNCFGRLERRGR